MCVRMYKYLHFIYHHHHHHHQVMHRFPWLSLAICSYHPLLWQVFQTTSCVRTELLLVGSCWSAKNSTSMWGGRLENLLQQCPACLVRFILMVLVIGVKWPYSCCFVRCCFQDLFNIAQNILVQFPSSFFSICFVSIYMVLFTNPSARAGYDTGSIFLSGV